jgi:hypothetical protein
MKLIALAAVTVIAGLSGCAALAPGQYTRQDDVAKMQAVNRAAQGQGVQVVWINAPQKLVRVAGS